MGNVEEAHSPDTSPSGIETPYELAGDVSNTKPRIAYIDSTRGLLILMMIVVHAATPCRAEIREAIQHTWLLGIATTGFAMLAGFTVGIRYTLDPTMKSSRLYQRSMELIVVMFYSNLLISLGKLYTQDSLGSTVTFSWILGLFTLTTPYNISGVLFPIALQLPLFPLIFRSEMRYGRWVYFAWLILVFALVYSFSQLQTTNPFVSHLLNLFVGDGVGGFPVFPFVGYGILGFATARVLHTTLFTGRKGWRIFPILLGAAVLTCLVWFLTHRLHPDQGSETWWSVIDQYVSSELAFIGMLWLGAVVAYLPQRFFGTHVINLLGFYGLFAFVIHRVIGHGLILTFDLKGGGYGMFLAQFISIVCLTYLACVARRRFSIIDRAFKSIYL